jgi:hypothetical protein
MRNNIYGKVIIFCRVKKLCLGIYKVGYSFLDQIQPFLVCLKQFSLFTFVFRFIPKVLFIARTSQQFFFVTSSIAHIVAVFLPEFSHHCLVIIAVFVPTSQIAHIVAVFLQ